LPEITHLGVEVSKTVAGELTEHTHEHDHQEAPAGVLGRDELGEVPPALVATVQRHRLLELAHLKMDVRRVGVSSTVVADDELAGLLLATLEVRPARALWQEENNNADDAGRNTLEDERKAPRPVTLKTESDMKQGQLVARTLMYWVPRVIAAAGMEPPNQPVL